MAKELLTPLQVKNAKPKNGKDTRYGDGGGLYLHVKAGGTKSWVLRFMLNGKIIERGLGAYPQLELGNARKRAGEWKEAIVAGKNPRPVIDTAPTAEPTFREAFEAVMDLQRPSFKPGPKPRGSYRYKRGKPGEYRADSIHEVQWYQTMHDYVLPFIGDHKVSAVTRKDVELVLKPYWDTKRETMRNVRSRIAIVLDWAMAENLRSDNPARQLGALKIVLRGAKHKVKHHRAMPYLEMQDFLPKLRALGSVSATALEFCILTACRTGEVIRARWDEFDLNAAMWVIPAERMKGGAEHRVPLSSAALALLERMRSIPSPGGWVFQSRASHLSNMGMMQCLRGIESSATVHGFRSTFRDWCADQTDYPHEVVEACLAHAVSDAVVAAYRHTTFIDKRRELMQQWADYLAGEAPQVDEKAALLAQIEALQSKLASL